jgi:hypothetical protein
MPVRGVYRRSGSVVFFKLCPLVKSLAAALLIAAIAL